ncbi:MAG: hypothetical protein GDA48_27065 [Hormoscilla sp. GM102CHS1]|nr:hypothetical protein [Hormoscilla sp. GM102CHS1]
MILLASDGYVAIAPAIYEVEERTRELKAAQKQIGLYSRIPVPNRYSSL